ncbi:Cofilin [Dactylellina cionopaga]|nr:Cofilin [Dactylellina cionopaga]
MASITVSQESVDAYLDLKQNKSRYILLRVSDKLTEIVLEKTVPLSAGSKYNDFLADLAWTECKFAVYNFEYDFEGSHRSKIVFFHWAPESSKVRDKMVYASSKDALKKALEGIEVEIQGTDKSEVEEAVVLEKSKAVSK